MIPKQTDCECDHAGWCERHQRHKVEDAVRLCQRSPDAMQRWDEARPLQMEINEQTAADSNSPPGVLQRASNFAGAAVRHAQNGLRKVPIEVYEQRLAICEPCPHYESTRMICTEKKCGCLISRKARWASEACPIGHWSAEELEANTITT